MAGASRLWPGNGADGGAQVVGVYVFEQESAGPGTERLEHVLVDFVGGEHEHVDPVEVAVGGDAPCRLEAVEPGHADVHEDYVGAGCPGDGDGFLAVGRLADDVEVVGEIEQGAETGAHDGLVVGQRHPHPRVSCHACVPSSGSMARTAKPPPICGPCSI